MEDQDIKCAVAGCHEPRWRQYKKCKFHTEHRDLTKQCGYDGCTIWIKESSAGCQGHYHRIKAEAQAAEIESTKAERCGVHDCHGIVKSGEYCDYHHAHPTLTVRCLHDDCCKWIEDDQCFCENHGAKE